MLCWCHYIRIRLLDFETGDQCRSDVEYWNKKIKRSYLEPMGGEGNLRAGTSQGVLGSRCWWAWCGGVGLAAGMGLSRCWERSLQEMEPVGQHKVILTRARRYLSKAEGGMCLCVFFCTDMGPASARLHVCLSAEREREREREREGEREREREGGGSGSWSRSSYKTFFYNSVCQRYICSRVWSQKAMCGS